VPTCYQSCSLYRPTNSKKCSRLEEINSSVSGTLTVRPLIWSKIESRYTGFLTNFKWYCLLEKCHALFVRVLPIGALVNPSRLFSRFLEETLNFISRRRKISVVDHDKFLFLAGSLRSRKTISLRFELPNFNSLKVFGQIPSISTREDECFIFPIGMLSPHDIPQKSSVSISFGGLEFNDPVEIDDFYLLFRDRPEVILSDSILKCVFWDLDGTVWEGTLVDEKGPDDLSLKPGIRTLLSKLSDSGVLNVIISKNDRDEVLKTLDQKNLSRYFQNVIANWQPKSINIKQALIELNLLRANCIFIDDSNFEREEVLDALPGISTIDAQDYLGLYHFIPQGPPTFETASRTNFYATESDRVKSSMNFVDYRSFLEDSQSTIEFLNMSAHLERAFELFSRSNQLNISGTKPLKFEIEQAVKDPNLNGFVARLTDKYGDYGIIGTLIVEFNRESNSINLLNLAISCRAMSRYVELSLLQFLLKKFVMDKETEIIVNYSPTTKNNPILESFMTLGFEIVPEGLLRTSAIDLLSIESPLRDIDNT